MNELSTNESENSALGQYYMKSVLLKLFLHYSNSLDHTKTGALSHSNFLQLLKDSQIISESFSIENADLFIRSLLQQQKTFNFCSFCESFFPLAEMVFAEEALISRTEAILRLLTGNIMPLYSSLLARGALLSFDLTLTPPLLQLLSTAGKYLLGLYKLYFSWETISAQSTFHIQKLSEKALLSLIHKYNVYPDIITRSLFKNIWENLIECPPEFVSLLPGPSIGKVLNYKKFCGFLLISSAFGSFRGKFENLHEKFLCLLENMEICSDRNEISGGSLVVSKAPSRQLSPRNGAVRKEIVIVYNFLKYFGNPKEVTFRKIKELLGNLGIIVENFYEIELIFKRFQKKGEIEAQDFVEMFRQVSKKIVDCDEHFDILLSCVLESPWFVAHKTKLQDYIEKISQDSLSKTCIQWEKSLKPFLQFYGRQELLSFEDILKFCSDFELYPDLITRTRLDETFYCFCVGENSEALTIGSVVLVLEICALNAFIPNLSDAEKMTSVLERALHSKGPGKVASCKGSNRTSTLMKAANPAKSAKKQTVKPPIDIDSILITYNPPPKS